MRHKLITVAQWLFACAVIAFAGLKLAQQWVQVRDRFTTLEIHWGFVIVASLLVTCTYAILIELWRRVLGAWGGTLRWGTAARIWFASNLGKYIPGNIWSVAALGMMARERGVSGTAAAGASVVVNLLNLASGLAVILLCGSRLIKHLAIFAVVAAVIVSAALTAPVILPRVAKWLGWIIRRNIQLPSISPTIVWLTLSGTAIAWLGYGVAFYFFSRGIVGGAGSTSLLPYIAVYTGAYILGFVTPVAPAGLGVREAGIVEGLAQFGLMGRADALILALMSRLWLTILEVAPGLFALATSQSRTHTRHA